MKKVLTCIFGENFYEIRSNEMLKMLETEVKIKSIVK